MRKQRLIDRFMVLSGRWRSFFQPQVVPRPDLHTAWQQPEQLPEFVKRCPVAQRYLALLGPLDWNHLPERNLQRNWGQTTIPYAAFMAACLVKLNEGKDSMADLRNFILEHRGLDQSND